MFGSNQLEMLQKMKLALEQSKARLAERRVVGEAGGGLVRIELDGNRTLRGLEINADLQNLDKDALEDYLSIALEKALEQANSLNESETAASAQQFMPGL